MQKLESWLLCTGSSEYQLCPSLAVELEFKLRKIDSARNIYPMALHFAEKNNTNWNWPDVPGECTYFP